MITLQKAAIEDVAALSQMSLKMNKEDGHPLSHDISQTILKLVDTPSYGQMYLIFKNEEMIGYLALCYGYSLELGGRDVCLDEIYIKPEHRGQGYGGMAIDQAFLEAQKDDFKTMYLEVVEGNDSFALYERKGFKTRGKIMYRDVA